MALNSNSPLMSISFAFLLWLIWAAKPLAATATEAQTAEIAIIVHPANGVELSKTEIYRIYLGKKRFFPNGRKAVAIELSPEHDIRKAFVQKVLHKSEVQLQSYWAYRSFRRKGGKPMEVSVQERVKELVASNPKYIGYISAVLADDSVKVISRF